jgi:hypothetical protein
MRLKFTLLLLFASTGLAQAAPHCAAEARERAKALLAFHYDAKPDQSGIDDSVKQLPPIRALKGNGKFDVLEVMGHINKADYRMRFIYAQLKDSCTLMGEEILEASNPY